MPLSALEFVPKEYYELLTGAMSDQPVTLSNTVSIGGDQRHGAAGLRVYGGLEVYASRAEASPGFGIDAEGFTWGGTRFEYTPSGLSVDGLEIEGDLIVHGTIQGDLPFDTYISQYLRELRPGVVCLGNGLIVGNADPWQAGLVNGQAALVVRGPDLAAKYDAHSSVASFACWSGNWLQFNVRFRDTDPSQGWQAKMLTLDFDADNLTAGTAGRITMCNGKVGIGDIPDVAGAIHALEARLAARRL